MQTGADNMKALPIGIENFKEMIDHQYYYVDKTNFIKDGKENNCYTDYTTKTLSPKYCRYLWYPTRGALVAGKTLNMSRRCPPRRAVLFLFDQAKGKRLSV